MKYCGYCDTEVDEPCTDSTNAMSCSKDLKSETRVTTNMLPFTTIPPKGRKDDTGKPRMDLLPPELLWAVACVLTVGAKKYSDRNWEKGMSWGRIFGALQRHLWAWWHGEKKDPETGFSHLWHAGCCIAFLIAYEERNIGEDDRNKDTII